MKLFSRILANIIMEKTPISEEQQGFRINWFTIDAIFITRQIKKFIEFDKLAFMYFVDLTKILRPNQNKQCHRNTKEERYSDIHSLVEDERVFCISCVSYFYLIFLPSFSFYQFLLWTEGKSVKVAAWLWLSRGL